MASGRGRANAARPKRRGVPVAGKPRLAPSRADLRPSRHDARQREQLVAHASRRRAAVWGSSGMLGVGLAVMLTAVLTGAATLSGPRPKSEVSAPPVAAGARRPARRARGGQHHGHPRRRRLRHDRLTGWPRRRPRGQGPRPHPRRLLRHPAVGGDHSPTWLNCGVYDQPVPNERAVHDLEHGAVWITYRPSLPASEVRQLQAFEARQSLVGATGSRYVDVSPYPGLSSPIVISSWGPQLRVSSPTDPRLQCFVDTFRTSSTYAPDLGGECTGGLGTPLQRWGLRRDRSDTYRGYRYIWTGPTGRGPACGWRQRAFCRPSFTGAMEPERRGMTSGS